MSKKLWIPVGASVVLLAIVYAYLNNNSTSLSESNAKSKEALVEETEGAEESVKEIEAEPIESKLETDDIEKSEREIEAEQTKGAKSESEGLETKNEIPAVEEELAVDPRDEVKEKLEESKREEKKELTAQDVSGAKLIAEPKLFRRFLNGRFNGTAKVKRNKKNEIWDITMYTKYEKEGTELSGESSIEVSGGEYSGRHRSEGSNRGFLQLPDGSILIEISPQAYMKVNRKNRERLRGQIFEKDKNSGNYLSLGKFELSREL